MTTTCLRHLADAGRRLRSYEKLTLDSTSVATGLTKISITHMHLLCIRCPHSWSCTRVCTVVTFLCLPATKNEECSTRTHEKSDRYACFVDICYLLPATLSSVFLSESPTVRPGLSSASPVGARACRACAAAVHA